MKLIMENWRKFRKEAVNEITGVPGAHEERVRSAITGEPSEHTRGSPAWHRARGRGPSAIWVDPAKNQAAAEHKDKFLELRQEFIETMIFDRREDLKEFFDLKIGNRKINMLASSWFVAEMIKFIKGVEIKFTNREGHSGAAGYYESSTNSIVVTGFDRRDQRQRTNRLKLTGSAQVTDIGWYNYYGLIFHELGHALSYGVKRILRKAATISNRYERNRLKSFVDDLEKMPDDLVSASLQAPTPEAIVDKFAFGTKIAKLSVLAGAILLHSTGDFVFNTLFSWLPGGRGVGLASTSPLAQHRKLAWEESALGKLYRRGGGYSSTVVNELSKVTEGPLLDSFGGRHMDRVEEFLASLTEIQTMLGRAILPIDIELAKIYRYGGHRPHLGENIAVTALQKEWLDTLPSKSRIMQEISLRTDENLQHAIRGAWRRVPPREWFEDHVTLGVLTNLFSIETFRKLDFNKDPTYIAKVLRDVFRGRPGTGR